MKPLPRVVLTSFRSVVFIAGLTLLALGLTDCATRRIEKQQQVAVIPQPDRWREFVAQADRGEIEEVSDGPEEREITSRGVTPRGGAILAARARAAGGRGDGHQQPRSAGRREDRAGRGHRR